MLLPLLATLLCAAPPVPEGATVSLSLALRVHPEGLTVAQVDQAQQAVHKLLAELTSFGVKAGLGERCADDPCLLALAAASGLALEVVIEVPEKTLEVRAAFADAGTGQVVRKSVRGGSLGAPEKALRMALESALPLWSRKGLASVAVSAPADSVVKVDGKRVALVPLPEPLGMPGGLHEVDVLLPSGHALSWQRRLEPGDRFFLDAGGALPPSPGSGAPSWRRPLAYGLWSAGALALAGSLVAGGLANRAGGQLEPCGVQDRGCLRIDQAERLAAQGQGYARTGNFLLVSGALLGSGGVGLFLFDLWDER